MTKKKKRKKSAKKKVAEKPAIEQAADETQTWPRAGDNKEFESILQKGELDQPEKPQAEEPKEPGEVGLKTSDVAEWVKWPFQLWASTQDLPPIIKDDEAIEIAVPLARIMNRHGVSDAIPPDLIDGLQVVGRTIPVIKRGSSFVTLERQRRAKAGQGKAAGQGGPAPQGAPVSKPKEV